MSWEERLLANLIVLIFYALLHSVQNIRGIRGYQPVGDLFLFPNAIIRNALVPPLHPLPAGWCGGLTYGLRSI
jgi:hypothetical protein